MKITHKINQKNNKTKKIYNHKKICGKITSIKQGWKSINVWGEPYERGFAHGYLLHKEMEQINTVLPFIVKDQLKVSMEEFIHKTMELIYPVLVEKYPEFYEEMRGIHEGSLYRGVYVSLEMIIGWNSFLSMYSFYNDGNANRCSAFIATGESTENGEIVMAHTTHSDFATGQLLNIVMTVEPSKGNSFCMQTSAGFICSTSDWFLCSNGIIGCETTIADINFKPVFGEPYFCRIRKVMQYANTLEECIKYMKHENSGDYSCSWLFGDIRTNEIMLFELGLKEENIERKKSGVFYGMNSAQGYNLRKKETTDKSHDDETTSVGSRNHRFNYLLNEKYYGKINTKIAKIIMSDHYDKELRKQVLNKNGICKHSENDPNSDYKLYGSTDTKITTTKMAKKMGFVGKFGPACGEIFNIKRFVKEHPTYKKWELVVDDFKKQSWVLL